MDKKKSKPKDEKIPKCDSITSIDDITFCYKLRELKDCQKLIKEQENARSALTRLETMSDVWNHPIIISFIEERVKERTYSLEYALERTQKDFEEYKLKIKEIKQENFRLKAKATAYERIKRDIGILIGLTKQEINNKHGE